MKIYSMTNTAAQDNFETVAEKNGQMSKQPVCFHFWEMAEGEGFETRYK